MYFSKGENRVFFLLKIQIDVWVRPVITGRWVGGVKHLPLFFYYFFFAPRPLTFIGFIELKTSIPYPGVYCAVEKLQFVRDFFDALERFLYVYIL